MVYNKRRIIPEIQGFREPTPRLDTSKWANREAAPSEIEKTSMKTWLLVADAAKARIFENHGCGTGLKLVAKLEHVEGRKKAHELSSDAPGQLGHLLRSRSPIEPGLDPKETEARRFALELADALHRGHNNKRFERLVLVAAPHFLGSLRHMMDEHIAKCVESSVDKDYTAKSEEELGQALSDHICP